MRSLLSSASDGGGFGFTAALPAASATSSLRAAPASVAAVIAATPVKGGGSLDSSVIMRASARSGWEMGGALDEVSGSSSMRQSLVGVARTPIARPAAVAAAATVAVPGAATLRLSTYDDAQAAVDTAGALLGRIGGVADAQVEAVLAHRSVRAAFLASPASPALAAAGVHVCTLYTHLEALLVTHGVLARPVGAPAAAAPAHALDGGRKAMLVAAHPLLERCATTLLSLLALLQVAYFDCHHCAARGRGMTGGVRGNRLPDFVAALLPIFATLDARYGDSSRPGAVGRAIGVPTPAAVADVLLRCGMSEDAAPGSTASAYNDTFSTLPFEGVRMSEEGKADDERGHVIPWRYASNAADDADDAPTTVLTAGGPPRAPPPPSSGMRTTTTRRRSSQDVSAAAAAASAAAATSAAAASSTTGADTRAPVVPRLALTRGASSLPPPSLPTSLPLPPAPASSPPAGGATLQRTYGAGGVDVAAAAVVPPGQAQLLDEGLALAVSWFDEVGAVWSAAFARRAAAALVTQAPGEGGRPTGRSVVHPGGTPAALAVMLSPDRSPAGRAVVNLIVRRLRALVNTAIAARAGSEAAASGTSGGGGADDVYGDDYNPRHTVTLVRGETLSTARMYGQEALPAEVAAAAATAAAAGATLRASAASLRNVSAASTSSAGGGSAADLPRPPLPITPAHLEAVARYRDPTFAVHLHAATSLVVHLLRDCFATRAVIVESHGASLRTLLTMPSIASGDFLHLSEPLLYRAYEQLLAIRSYVT